MTRCMARLFGWKSVLSIAALAGASMLVGFAARSEDAKPAQPNSALVARGEYLARAGDCIACHTAPEGKLFAGGLPMEAVRSEYESALPQLYRSGVAQEMADLGEIERRVAPERSGAYAIVGLPVTLVAIAREKGIPMVMIAPLSLYVSTTPDHAIVVMKNSPYRKASDLNGKVASKFW